MTRGTRARVQIFALGLAVIGMQAAGPAEAAVTRNKLASNRLAANRLAANKLAANKLAANALSATRLEAVEATEEMLSTADGREVYSYIVGCALDASMTIEAAAPGAPDSVPPQTNYTCQNERCVFAGILGLAPYWADRKLDHKGQRWVSACLLARVNHFDYAESISLRGLAPELTVGTDEAELFTLQEGAFFGNLFTDGDGPIDWNACRGLDQAAGESGGLAFRDCAQPDPEDPAHTYCGFNFAGDCADFTPEFPNPYSCKSFDGEDGAYGECHAEEADGHWPSLRAYREVITVYVSN